MRKEVLLGFVLTSILTGVWAVSANGNMLLNPGFEEGIVDGKEYWEGFTDSYPIDPPNYLYDWKLSSGGSGWSGYYAHNSYRCIYTTGLYIYAYQEEVDVTGGVEYNLGAWCRAMKDGSTPWQTGVGALVEIIWFPAGVDAVMDNYSLRISRQTVATFVPEEGDYGTYRYFDGNIIAPAEATGAIVLVGNKTAVAWTMGYFDDVYMFPAPTATPVFDPDGGYVEGTTLVTITCATPNAAIYYTLNGDEPTQTTGTLYTAPVSVDPGQTLKAKAWAAGQEPSEIKSASYWTYVGNMLLNPGFEDGYVEGKDYGDPFSLSFIISAPNELYNWGQSSTAGYWYGGYWNHTPGGNRCVSSLYQYNYVYQENVDVTPGVEYKLGMWCQAWPDGSTLWPEGVGALMEIVWFPDGVAATYANYEQRISRETVVTYIPASEDYNVWVYSEGVITAPANAESAMVYVGNRNLTGWAVGLYDDVWMSLNLPKVATPEFNPDGGLVTDATPVTITCETSGAVIYYTLNGDDPTQETGLLYSGPVSVNPGQTLKAKAWVAAHIPSDTKTATYVGFNRPATIMRDDGSVVVDADLSEWDGSEFVPLDVEYFGIPAISEAYYAVRWDGMTDQLYLAVKVSDSNPMLSNTYLGWDDQDCIEVYIHTTGGEPYDYAETQSSAQQYLVGIKKDRPSTDTTQHVWANYSGIMNVVRGDAFQAAGRVESGWLYYELKMTAYQELILNPDGTISSATISPLQADDIVGVDVVASDKWDTGASDFGMMAENSIGFKSSDWRNIGIHLLAESPQLPGDANGDGVVNQLDLNAVIDNWQANGVGWSGGDFNGDGVVNQLDLNIIIDNWQATSSIEEALAGTILGSPAPQENDETDDVSSGGLPCTTLGMILLLTMGFAGCWLGSLKRS